MYKVSNKLNAKHTACTQISASSFYGFLTRLLNGPDFFGEKKGTVNWLTFPSAKKLALCIMYMTILPTLISTEVKGRPKSKIYVHILNTPENQFWRNADKRS